MNLCSGPYSLIQPIFRRRSEFTIVTDSDFPYFTTFQWFSLSIKLSPSKISGKLFENAVREQWYLIISNPNHDKRHTIRSFCKNYKYEFVVSSVPDPEPDPRLFWPPGSGSGSTIQRCGSKSGSGSGSGSGSFYHHAKIIRKILNPTILWLFLTFYLWKIM